MDELFCAFTLRKEEAGSVISCLLRELAEKRATLELYQRVIAEAEKKKADRAEKMQALELLACEAERWKSRAEAAEERCATLQATVQLLEGLPGEKEAMNAEA